MALFGNRHTLEDHRKDLEEKEGKSKKRRKKYDGPISPLARRKWLEDDKDED